MANSFQKTVKIPADSVVLEGMLVVSQNTKAIVVFAHGSGSSRFSKRNNFVADRLHNAGLGTLLFDLLTSQEDLIYENRFDIPLLAERLKAATLWLRNQPGMEELNIGYFGASTGAAAALIAAATLEVEIGAVVSRGGRPDLAMDVLDKMQSPTLLIVGGSDDVVVELNKKAYEQIKAAKKLSIIPGATHLFEEPGALEDVAEQAALWFKKYLVNKRS